MQVDKIYIGDNLKFIEYTNDDLKSIKKIVMMAIIIVYIFGGGIIDISPKKINIIQ
ncbi:MAG: hypothetical protein L6U99_06405 [Clostridium sp.]|nr:MAG: hypothetical protein L6U99_06405 [Clostridium sp.]